MVTDPTALIQAVVSGLLEGAVYSLIALGLALSLAVTKLLNFAHGSLLMVAMYGVFIASQRGVPVYATALLIIPAFAILGWVAYRILLRRVTDAKFLMQTQMTLGVLFLLEGGALMIAGADPERAEGASLSGSVLRLGDTAVPVAQAINAGVAVAVATALYMVMRYTRLGRSLRALSEDPFAASLCGVNVRRMFSLTWAISFGLLGLAAPLLMMSGTVHPYVGDQYIVVILLAVVIGGIGDLAGAFVGSLLVGLSFALGQVILGSAMALLPAYVLVAMVLLIRPKGLLGTGGEL